MRYVCVHGHFYQPPRENAWLEEVEQQDSAHPFHDWNERITAECYAPNATARILDAEDQIVRIVNNYERISFNFGPTLASWLDRHAPAVAAAVVEADRRSTTRFGHGSALAQPYSHPILPLATRRDKRCQVLWGLADFERRFGRPAQGLWLPETAVDVETLELLAELGLGFTILSPRQAARVRPRGGRRWHDVREGRIDSTLAYEQRLPSGRSIALFFYDAAVSQAIAFERLLDSGERLMQRLQAVLPPDDGLPRLAHVATDGESYGHHHRFGEMALSWALEQIETKGATRLTNYASFLAAHPPSWQVEILPDTSWSCAHGIERWRADCGCSSGRAGWNQAWRAPLREALNWLNARLATAYEGAARTLLTDPWAAREAYVTVVLDRSEAQRARFLAQHARHELSTPERETVWQLLEMQRHALLMFTSCAWFFDELSGIETVQVLQYAACALHWAREATGVELEAELIERLRRAPSNLGEYADGAGVWERLVRPSGVDLRRVAARHAARRLFPLAEGRRESVAPAHRIDVVEAALFPSGSRRLVLERLSVQLAATEARHEFLVGLAHLGGAELLGGARTTADPAQWSLLAERLGSDVARGDLPAALQAMDQGLGGLDLSLKSLLRDEQRRIVDRLLDPALKEAGATLRALHERHVPLVRLLAELNLPRPEPLRAAAQYALDSALAEALATDEIDTTRVREIFAEARCEGVALDAAAHGRAMADAVARGLRRLAVDPRHLGRIARLEDLARLSREAPFGVALGEAETEFYALVAQHVAPIARISSGDSTLQAWLAAMKQLGRALRVRVPGPAND